MNKKKYFKLFIIAGVVVLLDQITKAVVMNQMVLFESIPVIPGFFNLTHIHNTGGAFGVFAGHSKAIRVVLFLFLSFGAVCLVLWFYHKTPNTHPWLANGFALIFGGAIGNLIDRVRMGEVVDFLDFYVKEYHWPAFNVADTAISTGVAIFAIHVVLNRLPE